MVTSVGQSRANDPSTVNVHVPTVLRFFDEVPQDSKGHATSIASLAGEDLAAGAVKHYLETVEKCRVDVLRESVTTGRLKGGRLDRWIDVQYSDGSTVLFQSEIKMWSAHAYGGRSLRLDASREDLRNYARERWHELWDPQGQSFLPGLERSWGKVLTPMRPPDSRQGRTVKPLLIVWIFLHSERDVKPLFSEALRSSDPFERIHFFSVSSYLRSCSHEWIELDMPEVNARLVWLQQLFAKRGDAS